MWPIRRGQESGSTPGAALRRTLFGILLYRIVWLSVLDGFIILISYFGSRRENGSGSTRGNHAPSWDRLLPCSGFLQVPPGLPCWTHGLHVGQESVESWALWDPPCEGCLSRRRCCEGCSLAPCPRTPAPTMGAGGTCFVRHVSDIISWCLLQFPNQKKSDDQTVNRSPCVTQNSSVLIPPG